MEAIFCGVLEAAKALGIGKTKAYELIADGSLKQVKIGRRSVVTVESVRAFAQTVLDD